MGIRFYCEACKRKLHVKAFLAGRLGVCPHCEARVRIPLETQIKKAVNGKQKAPAKKPALVAAGAADEGPGPPSDSSISGAPHPVDTDPKDPFAEAPEGVWYVRPPSGGQFGPAKPDVMQKWLHEGRVSADTLVWREGWEEWQSAGLLFPELDEAKPPDIAFSSEPNPQLSEPKSTNQIAVHKGQGRRRPNPNQRAVAIFTTLVVVTLVVLGILMWVLLSQ